VVYEKLPQVSTTHEQLACCAGRFFCDELPATYVLIVRPEGLALERRNREPRILLPVSGNRFSDGPDRHPLRWRSAGCRTRPSVSAHHMTGGASVSDACASNGFWTMHLFT